MDPSFKPKPLLNKSELRQIKKSRTKVEGKKVVTDDVRKLKSLKVTPELSADEEINYYKEPIWIEYYIPKESRFAYETKFLYVYLVDPPEREDGFDRYLKLYKERGEFFDIYDFIKEYPKNESLVMQSYHDRMTMFETIHNSVEVYRNNQDPLELKNACYVTEALMKFEPTLASVKLFPDFLIYNLNWLIRELNKNHINFSLEDTTISVLIKRRNEYWENSKIMEDEDFELLAALFYEQAFPHRGAEELQPDDFLME
ncbi:hypothetical protein [Leptospira sp. GIMC2001]|uniref:hypothetical protein n=1 Tax=Leptospira sp. GIMC2001 TaxID=1513297 RepID=UPI00234A3D95|nr:hypothetical protein [Leptospira sp. GIMC2001]WCL50558.1 hypothetical protein O4O04_07000 [Leptospira sp. GIMC2001]